MHQIESEIAEYVGDLCNELRTMAAEARLDTLAHLLGLAAMEAAKQSRLQEEIERVRLS